MTCLNCGREVDKNACGFYLEQGYVCAMCEGAEIEIFTIEIPGCSRFIANGHKDAIEFLKNEFVDGDSEGKITVQRGKMLALQYHNLKEWDG